MTRSIDRGSEYRANDSIASAFASPSGSATTALSISGTAAEATGLTQDATYRLWSDVNCFVLFDASADATTSDMPLTAELAEWITINDVTRLSAITSSATGTLYITKMGE